MAAPRWMLGLGRIVRRQSADARREGAVRRAVASTVEGVRHTARFAGTRLGVVVAGGLAAGAAAATAQRGPAATAIAASVAVVAGEVVGAAASRAVTGLGAIPAVVAQLSAVIRQLKNTETEAVALVHQVDGLHDGYLSVSRGSGSALLKSAVAQVKAGRGRVNAGQRAVGQARRLVGEALVAVAEGGS